MKNKDVVIGGLLILAGFVYVIGLNAWSLSNRQQMVGHVDSIRVVEVCGNYRESLLKKDWLRALVLHAELVKISEHSDFQKQQFCEMDDIGELYFKAQYYNYRSDVSFVSLKQEAHDQVKTEGLCVESFLYKSRE